MFIFILKVVCVYSKGLYILGHLKDWMGKVSEGPDLHVHLQNEIALCKL